MAQKIAKEAPLPTSTSQARTMLKPRSERLRFEVESSQELLHRDLWRWPAAVIVVKQSRYMFWASPRLAGFVVPAGRQRPHVRPIGFVCLVAGLPPTRLTFCPRHTSVCRVLFCRWGGGQRERAATGTSAGCVEKRRRLIFWRPLQKGKCRRLIFACRACGNPHLPHRKPAALSRIASL